MNRPAKLRKERSGVRVKRCGKSAPRVRRRNRHGKPHREQDRIGTATRVVRESDNVCGSDVRLVVRVGCSRPRASAVPEEWPSRLVSRERTGPYRTRLTGRLILINEGFGGNAPDPSPFLVIGGRGR